MLVKDGVTELLADVFTALAHWRIFPAVYGAAMTAAAALLLSVYTTTVVVVAFLILLAVYNLNNVFDTDEDETNNPEQTEFVRQRRRWVYAVVAISTVAAVLLSLRGGSWTPILVVSVFVSGVVYSVESVRLKQVFPINTILVAVTLSTVAVGVPVAFAGGCSDAVRVHPLRSPLCPIRCHC
jgi:4-hydroxybenzoate polyprenyltransferase